MKAKRIIPLLITACFTLCGCGNTEKIGANDFTVISSIEGVSFDVYNTILNSASFTSAISDTDLLNNAQTFVYRNDITDYLCYNSTSFAIVGQRMDSIGLSQMDANAIKTYISTTSFLKTSITTPPKKLSFKKSANKTETRLFFPEVEAGVSPNVNSFQNYYGALSVVDTGTYTYFLFMGTIYPFEEVTKDVKKIYEHTAKSLTYTGVSEPDVSQSEEEDVSQNTVNEEIIEETDGKEFQSISEDETATQSDIAPVKDIVEGTISEKEELKEEPKEEPMFKKEKTKGIKIPDNDGAIFVSDDIIAISSQPSGAKAEIRIYQVNQKADEEIKKEVPSFTAKEGTHFESVKYRLYQLEQTEDEIGEIYCDFRLKGLDGEKLTYMGIKYSSRTYDYEKGGYKYTFYEVPNGCKEYLLTIGKTKEPFHVKSDEQIAKN